MLRPLFLSTPRDIWAIGVITYFLLCGYTPFDRDSHLEEMTAILEADYSFTPAEYWNGVSQTARAFIQCCLTIDPHQRQTAHQALNHPWIRDEGTELGGEGEARGGLGGNARPDLLPTVRRNFNARVKLHAAIDTIRAINQLRAGHGVGVAARLDEGKKQLAQAIPHAKPGAEPMEGVEGTGQLGNDS